MCMRVFIIYVYADTACTRNVTNNSSSTSGRRSGITRRERKKHIIKQPEFIAPKMLPLLHFYFHILTHTRRTKMEIYTHAHANTRKHTADFTKCVDLFDLPFSFFVRHLSPLESIFLYFSFFVDILLTL